MNQLMLPVRSVLFFHCAFKAAGFECVHPVSVTMLISTGWKNNKFSSLFYFFGNLRKIETKVVYLKPMYYEEYKELNSKTICQIVYNRICKAVQYMENGNEKEALLQ